MCSAHTCGPSPVVYSFCANDARNIPHFTLMYRVHIASSDVVFMCGYHRSRCRENCESTCHGVLAATCAAFSPRKFVLAIRIWHLTGMRATLLEKREQLRAEMVHQALMCDMSRVPTAESPPGDSPSGDSQPADSSGAAKRQKKVRGGSTAWWHTLRCQADREGWHRT